MLIVEVAASVISCVQAGQNTEQQLTTVETAQKSGMPNELGFDVETDKNFRKDAGLCSESQSSAVVSVSPEQRAAFEQALQNKGVNFTKLGKFTAHACHLAGELSHAVKVAKKH